MVPRHATPPAPLKGRTDRRPASRHAARSPEGRADRRSASRRAARSAHVLAARASLRAVADAFVMLRGGASPRQSAQTTSVQLWYRARLAAGSSRSAESNGPISPYE